MPSCSGDPKSLQLRRLWSTGAHDSQSLLQCWLHRPRPPSPRRRRSTPNRSAVSRSAVGLSPLDHHALALDVSRLFVSRALPNRLLLSPTHNIHTSSVDPPRRIGRHLFRASPPPPREASSPFRPGIDQGNDLQRGAQKTFTTVHFSARCILLPGLQSWEAPTSTLLEITAPSSLKQVL